VAMEGEYMISAQSSLLYRTLRIMLKSTPSLGRFHRHRPDGALLINTATKLLPPRRGPERKVATCRGGD